MTDRLAGKVTIVTGAAGGIGLETATLFAAEGARVVLADTDEENGRRAVEMIRATGAEAVFVTADVSDEARPRRWWTPR